MAAFFITDKAGGFFFNKTTGFRRELMDDSIPY